MQSIIHLPDLFVIRLILSCSHYDQLPPSTDDPGNSLQMQLFVNSATGSHLTSPMMTDYQHPLTIASKEQSLLASATEHIHNIIKVGYMVWWVKRNKHKDIKIGIVIVLISLQEAPYQAKCVLKSANQVNNKITHF